MIACIYHSRDLDGWCSGAIVKMSFLDKHPGSPVYNSPYMDGSTVKGKEDELSLTLIGWDYGDEVPNLSYYNKVIMCDISFPKEVMNNLNETLDFVWIDHHISAIKENSDLDIEGLRSRDFSACELTWEYFYSKEKMPDFVRLLGRYDCFGHKGTNEEQKVLEYQYASRAYFKDVSDCYSKLLYECKEGMVIESIKTDSNILITGAGIYKYLCTEAEQDYKDVFEVEFLDGLFPAVKKRRFACINRKRFNPINFGIDYHKDGYDGFACYHYANGIYNFSLYNDNGKVDCSVIAKGYGGGGHRGAAGFRIDDIKKIIGS